MVWLEPLWGMLVPAEAPASCGGVEATARAGQVCRGMSGR